MTEQYAELRSRLVVGRKSDGRGVYDEAAKKELIVACLKQGVSVARMAMEHGVNTNLLRTWITTYQRRSAQVPTGGIAQTQDVECFPYPRTPSHPWFKEYFARLNSRGERYFSALWG